MGGDISGRRVRAFGGYLTHSIPDGSRAALCGFLHSPTKKGPRRSVQRAGWTTEIGIRPCTRCEEALDAL